MSKGLINHFTHFLITGIILVTTLVANAQNDCPEDGVADLINYSTLSPVQSDLSKITGWAKQDNGRWLSSKNRIPFTDDKTNQSSAAERKLGQDNIISLELRKVMIGNDQYNVLVKKYHDGEYEFPILREGWNGFESLDFYVFPSIKLEQILPDEVVFNQPYAVNLNVYTMGTIRNYKTKIESDEIVKSIQSVERGETVNDWNIVFAVYPIKNGDDEVVRFKLINSFRKKYLASYYSAPQNWEKNFDLTFYEVAYYQFKSFIREAQEYILPVTNPEGLLPEEDAFLNNYNWGVLKYQMGDYPTAIEYLDKAHEINPESTNFLLYSFRGNARSKMRQYDEAIADFDRALGMQPENIMDYSNWVKNYYNRGVAKFYLNDMTGACKDWNKALELGFGPAHDYLLEYCQ